MDNFNKETLEGKVDLEKVKEIRRAIRRRYANRRNLQKIFNMWDEENKGNVSILNAYNMIKKLNIHINFNEAQALIASADGANKSYLDLEEFLELVFSTNESLNVNLKKLESNILIINFLTLFLKKIN